MHSSPSVVGIWVGLHIMPTNSTNTTSGTDVEAGSSTWSDFLLGSGSRMKIGTGVNSSMAFVVSSGLLSFAGLGSRSVEDLGDGLGRTGVDNCNWEGAG